MEPNLTNLADISLKLRKALTGSKYNLDALRRIYIATSVSDYFVQDAPLGGYVPHKKNLQKKSFFI